MTSLSEMIGKTMNSINQEGSKSIDFYSETGEHWRMDHEQDCCESVTIDEVIGDLNDLVGSPIVMSEESTNSNGPPLSEYDESFTWTFYKFATAKGYVTVRWYGTSNGYYSEEASFERVMNNG